MSRIGTPYFDFVNFWYAARAIYPCPFYDHGTMTGESLMPGEEVHIKDEAHVTMDYVSCRTEHGWIRVWCRWNNMNEPLGMHFCGILTSPKQ